MPTWEQSPAVSQNVGTLEVLQEKKGSFALFCLVAIFSTQINYEVTS